MMNEVLLPHKDETGMVVSGGAQGADSLAKQWANDNHIPLIEFFPDWTKYGKSAAFIRNEHIIHNGDKTFAFWDLQSRGTKNSIEITKRLNKSCDIFKY
jgi:hypothetical protein